jgi:hypothetical protein
MDGWRDVWVCPAGGRPTVLLPVHHDQPAAPLSPLPAYTMHAYNACVVRASRHVFVSRPQQLKPQGSGARSPEPSLLLSFSPSLRFASLIAFAKQRPKQRTHTVTCNWPKLLACRAGGCQCLSPRRAGSAAPQTQIHIKSNQIEHAPHAYTYFTLYSTCRFRKFVYNVACSRSLW